MSKQAAAISKSEHINVRPESQLYAPLVVVPNSTGVLNQSAENIFSIFTRFGSGAKSWYGKEPLIYREFVPGWLVIAVEESSSSISIQPTVTVAQMITNIRNSFGLSMSALARILNVSRASLYNWLEQEPGNEKVFNHISSLHRFSLMWKDMNQFHYAPGKLLRQPLNEGPSMLERLGKQEMDEDEVVEGMEMLLALMKAKRDMMDRAIQVSKESSPEIQNETLDNITLKVSMD